MGLSNSNSALTLTFINAASVFGRLSIGVLSDHVDPWALALGILTSTAASVFVLWGVFSYSLPGLLVFGVFYGILASGWTSLFSAFMRPFASVYCPLL